jgi:hypothetical protein
MHIQIIYYSGAVGVGKSTMIRSDEKARLECGKFHSPLLFHNVTAHLPKTPSETTAIISTRDFNVWIEENCIQDAMINEQVDVIERQLYLFCRDLSLSLHSAIERACGVAQKIIILVDRHYVDFMAFGHCNSSGKALACPAIYDWKWILEPCERYTIEFEIRFIEIPIEENLERILTRGRVYEKKWTKDALEEWNRKWKDFACSLSISFKVYQKNPYL